MLCYVHSDVSHFLDEKYKENSLTLLFESIPGRENAKKNVVNVGYYVLYEWVNSSIFSDIDRLWRGLYRTSRARDGFGSTLK